MKTMPSGPLTGSVRFSFQHKSLSFGNSKSCTLFAFATRRTGIRFLGILNATRIEITQYIDLTVERVGLCRNKLILP